MLERDERWHQVVLIWLRDAPRFDEYGEAVTPIVRRYGGNAERVFTPSGISADGLTTPDVVNLVHSPSRAAYEAFCADPEFREIVSMRSESIDMLPFNGHLVRETPLAPTPERIYGIEAVRFADADRSGYDRYEAEGEKVMAEHGYRVEYVLDIIEEPEGHRYDQLKISSFPSQDDREAFERDPLHARIVRDLYPAAVEKTIWIDARWRPHAPLS